MVKAIFSARAQFRLETAHAQWKIAQIGEKQRRTAKVSLSYRKSMSLNPFSVRYLPPEVELFNALSSHAQTMSSQKSPKTMSGVRNGHVFIGKRVRWLQK